MNITAATESYETWLGRRIPVVASQLRAKHALMRQDPFAFLRGTFYRWAQLWPQVDRALRRAPTVLAVGDLHVDSFGTWRDIEGRLAWGVDDFDDAYPLPYTNDLVRLATSLKIATDAGLATIGLGAGCDAILERYTITLRQEGERVLAHERVLRAELRCDDGDAASEPGLVAFGCGGDIHVRSMHRVTQSLGPAHT